MSEPEVKYQGKYLSFMNNGSWEYVSRKEKNPKGAVGVIAVNKSFEVLFVRQFRPSVGRDVIDIPAGLIDGDESPLDTAKRELREETGYYNGLFRELGEYVTSPGLSDETITLFWAAQLSTDFNSQKALGVDGEKITLLNFHVRDAHIAVKALAKYSNCLVDIKVAYALQFIAEINRELDAKQAQ